AAASTRASPGDQVTSTAPPTGIRSPDFGANAVIERPPAVRTRYWTLPPRYATCSTAAGMVPRVPDGPVPFVAWRVTASGRTDRGRDPPRDERDRPVRHARHHPSSRRTGRVSRGQRPVPC